MLQKAILQLPESTCPAAEKIEAVMAINKVKRRVTSEISISLLTPRLLLQVLWIQNDLFSRHYIGD